MPLSLVNATNRIYVTIGNIGPYVSEGNVTVTPDKDQMIGCVDDFFYNDSKITFANYGEKVMSPCIFNCTRNICNGGSCHQVPNNIIHCDCASAELDGQFCNKRNNQRRRDTYNILTSVSSVYLQMAWIRSLSTGKRVCLMELVYRDKNVAFMTENATLIVGPNVTSNIKLSTDNNITFNISRDYLLIRIGSIRSNMSLSLNDIVRINVGFSDKYMNCERFSGTYDFKHLHDVTDHSTHTSTQVMVSTETYHRDNHFQMIILFISITFGCCLVVFVIGIVIFKRCSIRLENQIQILMVRSTNSLNQGDEVIVDPGQYGTVDDAVYYDYIRETDVYATVCDKSV